MTIKNSAKLSLALAAWRTLLGDARVISEGADLQQRSLNLTEYRKRISAVLHPVDRAQLIGVVEIAGRFGIPLYPVSQGKNWGQGSALPAKDDCVVVSLRDMNQILEVNERFRYAVIEPGVTQEQLALFLQKHHPSLMLNVTGSGKETSVVGNVLERGAALFGQRSQLMLALEVLLADGSLVRTGHWHYTSAAPHFYSHGVGPDISGLFAQSNLGIVTAMVIRLMPHKRQRLVCITLREKNLQRAVDSLFYLKEDGILRAGPVIMNKNDHRVGGIIPAKPGDEPWFILTSLQGDGALLAALQDTFENALRPHVESIDYIDESHANLPPFIQVLLQNLRGMPSDFSLQAFRASRGTPASVATHYELDYDLDVPGMACALPAVPFSGEWVQRVIQLVRDQRETSSFAAALTFVCLTPTAFEGFIRVTFDRRDTAMTAAAHAWNQAIYTALEAEGLLPYRLSIEHMPAFTARDNPFWHLIGRLKTALDPQHLLAPGRYGPGVK